MIAWTFPYLSMWIVWPLTAAWFLWNRRDSNRRR